MSRNLSLLASVTGVFSQALGLMMILARRLSNVHALHKASPSLLEGALYYGGWAMMFGGLCFYARAKGRTWLWALISLIPFPPFLGFLLSLLVLLRLPRI